MDKMKRIRGEIPTFKRCCMCLPLRHGLIVWGYIRVVIGVLLLIGSTNCFLEMLGISKQEEEDEEEESYVVYIVLFGFFIILTGSDIVLNVVFVYAGHMKDIKMLRAYYIYSFILWVLMLIMGISLSVKALHDLQLHQIDLERVWFIFWDLISYLSQIVIQAYVTLLVRSEFVKLSRNCEFRFVNNAAESACEMKLEEENIGNDDDNITANKYIVDDGGQEGDQKYETSEANDALLC